MAKNVSIAIIVGIVIIVGVIGYQLYDTSYKRTTTEDYYEKNCDVGCDIDHIVYPSNPQFLYGLKINKDKYLLGESVFVTITDIPRELKTNVIFYTPQGKEFHVIPVNGEIGSGFKQYFKPQLLKSKSLCNVSDLIGEWKVIFENLPSKKLTFRVMDEFLPNNERYYEPQTCGLTKTIDPNYMP